LAAVILLPIILQVVAEFPGPFDEYLRYLRDSELPPRGIGTVTRFLAQYWAFGSVWWIVIPTVVGIATLVAYRDEHAGRRRFHLALVGVGILASATTFLYGYTGVDDFSYIYLALFYAAVPIVFWTVLATGLFERWKVDSAAVKLVAIVPLLAAWLFVLAQPGSSSLYAGSDVGTAYNELQNNLAPQEQVALSLAEHGDWAVAVGVFEQLRRNGYPACARVWPVILEILFTPDNLCDAEMIDRTEIHITSRNVVPESAQSLVFDGENYDIWILDD
jgi:hypothetical protein